MLLHYCWHRPGRIQAFRRASFRMCRNCNVPLQECPCVDWCRTPNAACSVCEGSGWIAIIRSRAQTVRDVLGSFQEAN